MWNKLYRNEKKEENLSNLQSEQKLSALYWLCKEEEAHSELNSLLEPVESLQDVAPIKKRSSRKRTVINTGQSEKEN